MRRLPPLTAVRAFEAAARHGNFTRAAEELGMTQAAVSYQMKLLEERLGAPVFARVGRGIVLTDLGRRIAPQVTGAFEALGDAFASARAENDSLLTISAPRTFSTNWLAYRLGSFHVERAPLAVRLDVCDEMIDFGMSEIDVAIRCAPEPWPGLVSHFMMRMPLSLFASPAFLARFPKPRAIDDLAAMPRISLHDEWWDLWRTSLTGAPLSHPDDSRAGMTAGLGFGFGSQVLDGTAALAGHGIAILSPVMWQESIAAGALVQVHDHVAYYDRFFWLVYPEYKRNLPKVRAFREWLFAEVAASVGADEYGALTPPWATSPET